MLIFDQKSNPIVKNMRGMVDKSGGLLYHSTWIIL